jgi:hypothetical protein
MTDLLHFIVDLPDSLAGGARQTGGLGTKSGASMMGPGDPTTYMTGEEGDVTTYAIGEEGDMTTYAIGEEGNG